MYLNKFTLITILFLSFFSCKKETQNTKKQDHIKKDVVKITDSSFEQIIATSNQPVVIYLWADWCGPCKFVSPIINELKTKYRESVIINKINVDTNPKFLERYKVRNIPTILIFKNGKLMDRLIGSQPKESYIQHINNIL